MPSTVPPAETVHPPTVAQMIVAPLLDEKLAVPDHEYEPELSVIVAPSLALSIAFCRSTLEEPAGHDHFVPLPVHAACAGTAEKMQIAAIKQLSSRIRFDQIVIQTFRSQISLRLPIITGQAPGHNMTKALVLTRPSVWVKSDPLGCM